MGDPRVDRAAVTEELYRLSPGDFVAARDRWVRRAREAGDRPAADAIAALRKPTVAGWLLNLLVRADRAEVEGFVALGAELREATATLHGSQLRELSTQRRRLVQALVDQARRLGHDAGQRVGEDALRGVEETLHAALADPAAAQELLAGRLVRPLSRTGFTPAVSPAGSTDARPAGGQRTGRRRGGRAGDDRGRDERAALEREHALAWAAAREAADARDTATQTAAAARREADEAARTAQAAAREVARLRQDLAAAEADLATAEQAQAQAAEDAGAARDRQRQAEGAADAARSLVTDLQARLDAF